jgi:hypothetical protein
MAAANRTRRRPHRYGSGFALTWERERFQARARFMVTAVSHGRSPATDRGQVRETASQDQGLDRGCWF